MCRMLACDCILVGFVLVLLTLAASEANVNQTNCDRYRSRKTSIVVQDYILPRAEKLRYTLPEACLVHPKRNIYALQEAQRVQLQRGQWQCGICGQTVRGSHHLDFHMDEEHQDQLIEKPDSLCLADVCTALHCDFFSHFVSGHVGYGFGADAPCREAVVKKHRRLCEEVADTCFPRDHSGEARKLHDYVMHSLCKAHTCHLATHRQMLRKIVKAEKKFHMGYRVFAVFVFLFVIAFYCSLWWYYRQHSGYRSNESVRRLHAKRKTLLDVIWPFGKNKRKKQF